MERTKFSSSKKSFKYQQEQEPIILSKAVLDLLLKDDKPAEVLSLYCFYYYTAKWQKTNLIKSTTNYTAQGLNWSCDKVRQTKLRLKNLKLIEDIQTHDSFGRVLSHNIRINLIWYMTPQPHENPHCGFSRVYNNINTSNKILPLFPLEQGEEASKFPSTNIPIIPSLFFQFWRIYPRKIDKGKTLTSWNKICKRSPKERPTWRQIKLAILEQKKSDRWQENKFIPHPTTWLNQSRWLDDPKEMKSYLREEEKCPQNKIFGKDFSYSRTGCMNCEEQNPGLYHRCKTYHTNLNGGD